MLPEGCVALHPYNSVMLGHLVAAFSVFAEVSILESAAEKEQSSILQKAKRVGPIG